MLHDPEEEHDCFSDNTHNSHYYDAQGIANVYLGRYRAGGRVDGRRRQPGRSGGRGGDPTLDAEMRARLDATLAAMQAIKDSGRPRRDGLRSDDRRGQSRGQRPGAGGDRRACSSRPRRSSGSSPRSISARWRSRAPTAWTTPRPCSSRSAALAVRVAATGCDVWWPRRWSLAAAVERGAGRDDARAARRDPGARPRISPRPERWETLSGGSATNRGAVEPQRLLAALGQSELRGARRLLRRQRPVPAQLGDRAGIDPGRRRPGAAVQRPRLPGLPPQGRPRPPAGGAGRLRGLDVPAPVDPARERGRARAAREPSGERHRRADLRRPAAGSRRFPATRPRGAW